MRKNAFIFKSIERVLNKSMPTSRQVYGSSFLVKLLGQFMAI